ncbi:MAG TPA: TIGR03885 family FMN-dependent LLM class oxidoreductase [Chloroflexaceae bacterium]|nr:TIGR03885 family FMN-dependent LLM class oxidoreductase [Chloroflexaceae bacterium]
MATIGYHASHEQWRPSELLRFVRAAEEAGFAAAMCSDHFHPWSERQAQSGFAWSWLGAAMGATALGHFGLVNAPGQRYHPAIIAQAAATLDELFPGRLWVAMGSGQALNEHITGARWPSKAERNQRLRDSVEVIRRLWTGETVSFEGPFFTVDEARLYTTPRVTPRIIAAALSPETAGWAAEWADGMITTVQPRERMRAIVQAFRDGGGADKPLFLQAQHSYARDEAVALAGAHDQWRTNIFASPVLSDLRMPYQFDAAASYVRPEEVAERLRVSSDLARHVEWLQEDLSMGFDHIYIHNVNREQEPFIAAFGERVLPALRG